MREVNKLALIALIKVILIFAPISVIVLYLYYIFGQFLISHNMGDIVFIPQLFTIIFLLYVAKRMLGPTMKKMSALRRDHKRDGG